MKVNLNISPEVKEESVTINARELTPELKHLVEAISSPKQKSIIGYKDEDICIMQIEDILLFYTEKHYIKAKYIDGEDYRVKGRMYELEEMLAQQNFVRISNSAICNFNHLKKLQISYDGAVCVVMSDGTREFISKRCIGKIKKRLGV